MVKVHYTGTLADGSVFDSSLQREPLQFKLGCGQVIPGFEQAVLSMNVGETKTVTDINEKAITLDANHALAGKDLTFELTLIEED
jgi:peptidylprolyl isomerase